MKQQIELIGHAGIEFVVDRPDVENPDIGAAGRIADQTEAEQMDGLRFAAVRKNDGFRPADSAVLVGEVDVVDVKVAVRNHWKTNESGVVRQDQESIPALFFLDAHVHVEVAAVPLAQLFLIEFDRPGSVAQIQRGVIR